MTRPTDFEWMPRARAAQSRWSQLTVRERCQAVRRLRHRIAEQASTIVDTLSAETGKTPLDAISGDVLVTLEQLLYNENHADRLLKTRTAGRSPLFYLGARFEEVYEPFGVVLIYSPANYPIQLSIIPTATALLAGNAVILKCSEKTPRTAHLIENLYRSASLPKDLVQVTSADPEAAANLIHTGPDMVFFTGSSENGRKVAKHGAERLIPTLLELGGKDPCLVFADCNFRRAVQGVAYGAFSNAGQVCVGIKRLYIEASIFPSFVDALTERVRGLRIGRAPDSDLGTLPQMARARFKVQVENAIQRGARVHLPSKSPLTGFEPVILSGVPLNSGLLLEETFGPVVCVAPFRDEGDAIALANAGAFALSCSVWTGDAVRGKRIATQMTAGSCAVNDVIRNIANPYASFGGNLQSGHGRYHGPQGLLAFSRSKGVMIIGDRSKREQHWFPYTQQTYELLQRIIAFRHREGSVFARLWRLLFPVALIMLRLSAPPAAAGHGAQLHMAAVLSPDSHGNTAYFIFDWKNGFSDTRIKALRGDFVPHYSSCQVEIDAGAITPGGYGMTAHQEIIENHNLDKALNEIPQNPSDPQIIQRQVGTPDFGGCAFHFGNSNQPISLS